MSGILAWCLVTAVALRLIPPVPSTVRAHRLLAATLDDLRDLASSPTPPSRSAWETRIHRRLSALPEAAEPVEGARLVAAVGNEVIRLRIVARRFGLQAKLAPFRDEIAGGNDPAANEALANFDRDLAALPHDKPGTEVILRARASVRAVAEALDGHAAYFGARTGQ